MEHNPFIAFEDGTEMTYSSLKKSKNMEYITIYFETPHPSSLMGFKSAQLNYPGGDFEKIIGYTQEEMVELQDYVDRSAGDAFSFAKEDELCQVL